MYVLSLLLLLPVIESDQFNNLVRKAAAEGKDYVDYDGERYEIIREGQEVSVFALNSTGTDPPDATESPNAFSALAAEEDSLEGSGYSDMGGSWSGEEDEEERGKKFVERICANRKSKKCADLKNLYNIPADPVPVTDDQGAVVVTTEIPIKPVLADPCKAKSCYTWGNFRENVLQPFAQQMEEFGDLGKLPGDQAKDNMFNPNSFREWREASNIPRENQGIAAATAATMSLKLLTAVLSQVRLTRVEMEELDSELPWTTWLSIPGFLLLLVYLCISIHQIKTHWKRRLLQTEEQKATRMFEHFLRLQQDASKDRLQDLESGVRYRDPRTNATLAHLREF